MRCIDAKCILRRKVEGRVTYNGATASFNMQEQAWLVPHMSSWEDCCGISRFKNTLKHSGMQHQHLCRRQDWVNGAAGLLAV